MRRRSLEHLLLRPLVPSDRPFLAALIRRSSGRREEISASAVDTTIVSSALTVVALLDDEPVGFAVLRIEHHAPVGPWRRPRIAHLDAVLVDGPWRKRGIGASLLARVEETARRRQAGALFLRTDVSNGPARMLFESAGFAGFAAFAAGPRRGQAVLLMLKALNAD